MAFWDNLNFLFVRNPTCPVPQPILRHQKTTGDILIWHVTMSHSHLETYCFFFFFLLNMVSSLFHIIWHLKHVWYKTIKRHLGLARNLFRSKSDLEALKYREKNYPTLMPSIIPCRSPTGPKERLKEENYWALQKSLLWPYPTSSAFFSCSLKTTTHSKSLFVSVWDWKDQTVNIPN